MVFKETKAYRPFAYPWAMEMAQEHSIDLYWDTHQVEMLDDIRQFHAEDGLKTDDVSHAVTKNMLNKILAIFTQMDLAAGALYCELLPHVRNNEIRNMWMTFAQRESVHQRAYAKGVEVFGMPESTWTEFLEYQEMRDKIDLMLASNGDLTDKLNFAKTLAQLLLAEGISLFGAFACMLNLKRFGLLMGLNLINEWSLRDEQKHVEGNMLVLAEVRKDLTIEENSELDRFIVETVENYREAEHKFIELLFEMGPVQDMTAYDMKHYIDYLCNLRLGQLDFDGIYDTETNPLEWMDYVLSGKTHTNFFEAKVTEYSHTGLPGEINYSKYQKNVSFF